MRRNFAECLACFGRRIAECAQCLECFFVAFERAARAFYRPGEGIYLDDSLKPEANLFDRSILLHELVHYVQDMSGERADVKPCLRWYQREQEAYAIQKVFLGMTGSPTRVGYSAHKSTCDDEPVSAGATQAK